MKFLIVINFLWGDESYPINSPIDAHTGNMLLIIHNSTFSLFKMGKYASSGIIESAEYGTTNGLEKQLKNDGNISRFYMDGVIDCPNVREYIIDVLPPYDYVSFAAMLAPSQCNFTGFSHIKLEDKIFPIYALSAGTQVDDIFVTEPKKPLPKVVPIHRKTDAPFFQKNRKVVPVGYVSIERLY